MRLTLAGEALLGGTRQILHDVDSAVSMTRSVGGELVARMARFWATVADLSAHTDLQDLRDAFEALHGQFTPPPQVRVRPVNADGSRPCWSARDCRSRRCCTCTAARSWMGSAFGYQSLVGALVAAVTESALVPEYRLAPEHPFPTALEDATRAYLWLVRNGAETLAGDSSGAGLALSLLLSLKQQGRPLPGRRLLHIFGMVQYRTTDGVTTSTSVNLRSDRRRRWMG